MGTVIVSVLLVLMVGSIIYKMIKDKKAGKSLGCSCGCSNCSADCKKDRK